MNYWNIHHIHQIQHSTIIIYFQNLKTNVITKSYIAMNVVTYPFNDINNN